MKPIKIRVKEWILELINKNCIDSEEKSLKEVCHYFKIEGFCDEPEIFLAANTKGLEWGYDSVNWVDPATPIPTKETSYKISWEALNSMSAEGKMEKMIDTTIKYVNSKKREYRRCEYCNRKMHSKEFYDKTTCFECAKKHLGIYIVY